MIIKYEQFIFKNPWALLKSIGLNLRWSKVCLEWYDYLLDQRMLDNIRLHDFLKLASSIFKFNYKCIFHLVIKWQTIEYDWKNEINEIFTFKSSEKILLNIWYIFLLIGAHSQNWNHVQKYMWEVLKSSEMFMAVNFFAF